MVRDFRPSGDPQEILAKQSEYASEAFEIMMQNTRDVAGLAKKVTTDATPIIRGLRDSQIELRDSVSRVGGDASSKT